MPDGVLLVDKPAGMTSHDVVEVVRRRLGVRRVGHAGTLDPLATGLLVVLVGAATKHQRAIQAHEKEYEAVIQLGTQTETGDAEGACIRQAAVPALDEGEVARALQGFVGSQAQTPPRYSAVKVRGRPAYWWARRDQAVTLSPRTIHVSRLELLGRDATSLTVRLRCSAGTYVRALAEAIAERLGTVGHLGRLVRVASGPWRLDDARSFAWLTAVTAGELSAALRRSGWGDPCAS